MFVLFLCNAMDKTILIVDNEIEYLSSSLGKEGYSIVTFRSTIDALSYLKKDKPDLIISEWDVSGIDGLDFCKLVTRDPETSNIPFIMLSNKQDEMFAVTAFEIGVEDFILKPLRLQETIARVKKILKKSIFSELKEKSIPNQIKRNILEIGDLKLDYDQYKFYFKEEEVELSHTEFKIMQLLMNNPGRVYTRYAMIEKISGIDSNITERAIDVQVAALRKKLKEGKNYIETVRNVGYRMATFDYSLSN